MSDVKNGSTPIKYAYLILAIIILCTACFQEKKPKIVHEDRSNIDTTNLSLDKTKIKMADLPIYIDSTSYLLHPIGEFNVKDERGETLFKSSSFRYSGTDFSISRSDRYGIYGDLSNIMFQHISSPKITVLTKKKINIQSVTFLSEVYEKTKQEFLLYVVNDTDTNQDKKLNRDDIKTLYLSEIDGSNFKKLTASNRELIDWKIVAVANKIYFRTIEDTNKDGEFNQNDKIFYQYVNLSSPTVEIVEYNVL